MAEPTLYDNDAVLKLSAYCCWETLSTTYLHPAAVLKVATFSLETQLKKARRITNVAPFQLAVKAFLASCIVIEPTDEEIQLATEFEEGATTFGAEFDTGESQLVAVLITRLLSRLVTGDKRAITAMVALKIDKGEGKILCLEQVLKVVIENGDWQELRSAVCAERSVDTAVAMAFSCYSSPSVDDVVEGLDSYIGDLRSKAGAYLSG